MILNSWLKKKSVLISAIVVPLMITCNQGAQALSACAGITEYFIPGLYPAVLIIIFFCILTILILGNLCRKRSIELKALKIKFDLAEHKIQALFSAIPDLIFVIDDNYNFVDYKAEVEDDLYALPSDFIGKNINEVLPPELAEISISRIKAVIQTGAIQKYNYELDIHGEKLFFNARVIRFADGYNVVVVRNISETKKREEEKTKSHRLESITSFASGIAHDFNNILTIIAGYISIAMKKIENINNRSNIIKLLNEAEKEVMGAGRLTEQLLIFSKDGTSVKEDVDIRELVIRSADFVMSGSKTAVNYNLPDTELKVKVDINRMSQVIQNIVLNASQAMNSAGTVNIAVEKQILFKGNKLSLGDGEYVVIKIQDEGEGIEARDFNRIFDPYFTTKRDCNGLGLSICRNIIDDHGGYIDVKSQVGKGSVFTVYIPVRKSEEIVDSGESILSQTKTLSSISVLIMDDEPQLRYIIKEVLEDDGAKVYLASEGIEAIELFEKLVASGKTPDLIIADLTIPGGMGGMETIRIMREQGVAFKAIVTSGYSNDPVIADYKNYGFDAYLVKPFTSKDLLATIKKIC